MSSIWHETEGTEENYEMPHSVQFMSWMRLRVDIFKIKVRTVTSSSSMSVPLSWYPP